MMPSWPHKSIIATGEAMTISTAVLKLCGQDDIGPSTVDDQSSDWIRDFISFARGDMGLPVRMELRGILRKPQEPRYVILHID